MQKNCSMLAPAAITVSLSLLLAGCWGGSAKQSSGDINQDEICEANNSIEVENCKPGQKVAFLPSRFGNEQLPVYFAAANCDLRYSVVQTNGGVTCIFLPIKPKAPVEAASAASSPASAANESTAK